MVTILLSGFGLGVVLGIALILSAGDDDGEDQSA